jgi:RNA polymerase sigma-70 factor, ECF subfamily
VTNDFKKLLLDELDAVYRLARHLCRGTQEADDAVQETYLRAIRSAHTFIEIGPLGIRPWLFKILHNVIHSAVARETQGRRREDLAAEQRTPKPAGHDGHQADESQVGAIDWERVDERLKHAIAELDMPFREAFLLAAIGGLKYREIGQVLDVPIGTVMSRISRARALLASRLGDMAIELRLQEPKPTDDPNIERTSQK